MSENVREQVVDVPAGNVRQIQEVRATITRACPHCGAGDPSRGSHLHPWVCQDCGGVRPADEIPGERGLIWRRVFRLIRGD